MQPNTMNVLTQARHALQANDRPAARALLSQILRANPANADAWLLLSEAVDTPAQRRDCLERVLILDPQQQRASHLLAQLDQPPAAPPSAPLPTLPSQSLTQPSTTLPPNAWEAAPASLPPVYPTSGGSQFAPASLPPVYPTNGGSQFAPTSLPPVYPNSGGPLVTNPTVFQPHGFVPQPAPARRKRPLWLDIPLALIVLLGAVYIIGRGLQATEGGRAQRAAAALPVPAVSAEKRVDGFLNAMYANMLDDDFYDAQKFNSVIKPILTEYVDPAQYPLFTRFFKSGAESTGMSAAESRELNRGIAKMQVRQTTYDVIAATPAEITLKLSSAKLEMIPVSGETVDQTLPPVTFKLTNINGRWMLSSLR